MKVFITGSSGFIGSYLLHDLAKNGHAVLALKRPTTNMWRVEDIKDSVQWVDDNSAATEVVEQFAPEIIFNLAWAGVAAAERIDWALQESNIQLQQRWLDVAYKCKTKKFVGIGSQSEYGAFESKVDELYPENPNTAYAAVKKASLEILKAYCETHDMDWYWFRVFPCFGPTEDDRWLIPSLVKNIFTQDHMDLTPGEQKLAYLYVGEVARSIYSAIDDAKSKTGVYNICADNPIPLKQLVSRIRDIVKPSFQLNFGALDYRPGQCMYMEGDTTKLRNNLYNLDTRSFDLRLQETIDYYIKKYSNGNQ